MKKQTVTATRRSLYARCRVDELPAYGTDNAREPKMIIFYGHRTAVFRGNIPDLPDSLKYSGTFIQGETVLRRVNFAGSDSGDFLKNAVKWYICNGYTPIIDTIRR